MRNVVKELLQELTYPEMRELRKALDKKLKDEKRTMREDIPGLASSLAASACFILGLPELKTSSRKKDQVVARIVIANCLLERGATQDSVAAALGLDHSSIHYYSRLLEAWKRYPSAYEKELRIYKFVKGAEL